MHFLLFGTNLRITETFHKISLYLSRNIRYSLGNLSTHRGDIVAKTLTINESEKTILNSKIQYRKYIKDTTNLWNTLKRNNQRIDLHFLKLIFKKIIIKKVLHLNKCVITSEQSDNSICKRLQGAWMFF